MSEGEAAPAALAWQGSRNLVMRVAAAAVLAPLAIAIAYAGGWLWLGFVTLAAIGLYVEWLTIVSARTPRVVAAGVVMLLGGAAAFGTGRVAITCVLFAIGVVVAALLSPHRRGWVALGCGYAFAALIASVAVRLDPVWGFTALLLVLLRWPVPGALALAALAVVSPAATPSATMGTLHVAQRRRFAVAAAVAAAGIVTHVVRGLWRPFGGLPFIVVLALAGLVTAAVGLLLGLPAARLRGHYLAVATLGFGLAVPEIALNGGSLTGGYTGLIVPPQHLGSVMLNNPVPVYYLVKPGQASPYDWFPYAALGVIVVSVAYAIWLSRRDPGLGDRVGSIVADE